MVPNHPWPNMQPYSYEWKPWKRRFAWTKTVVNNEFIWFKFYYERTGVKESNFSPMSILLVETASDLLDVLRKS